MVRRFICLTTAVLMCVTMVMIAPLAQASVARGHTLSIGSGSTSSVQYKPRSLYLTGDNTLTMTHSKWSSWSKRKAVGHGTAVINTCDPSCADGNHVKRKMSVKMTRPKTVCGHYRVFTRYRVTLRGKLPEGITHRTFTLDRSDPWCNS